MSLLEEYFCALANLFSSLTPANGMAVIGPCYYSISAAGRSHDDLTDVDELFRCELKTNPSLTKEGFLESVKDGVIDEPQINAICDLERTIDASKSQIEELSQRGVANEVIPPHGMTSGQWVIHVLDVVEEAEDAVRQLRGDFDKGLWDACLAFIEGKHTEDAAELHEGDHAPETHELINCVNVSIGEILGHLRKQVLVSGGIDPFGDPYQKQPESDELQKPKNTANDDLQVAVRSIAPKSERLSNRPLYHKPTEQRPAEYRYGPITGKKNEICTWMGEKPNKNMRRLNQKANKTVWVIRHSATGWEVWFKDERIFQSVDSNRRFKPKPH